MNRVQIGDCRAILPTLPEKSFHTCVTSPPYFGLRDYGTARWEGGDDTCDHRRPATGGNPAQGANKGNNNAEGAPFFGTCGKCGATRHDSQIGLEPTPDAYVAELVSVFREVRRVLRDDGTLWLNLGDSYAANRGYQVPDQKWTDVGNSRGMDAASLGLKPKDLIGIPWRVAFALQADGWYLRSDIVWSKPNPMPESVTDRPTKAHEYLFLLSKNERYYYDAEAIAEPLAWPDEAERKTPARFGGADKWTEAQKQSRLHSGNEYRGTPTGTRNRRTVWTIPTTPYSGAHFAVMPEKLIEPCILAGCPEGGLVLDPFFGSGTVGQMAERLGRRWFGCELNPKYKPLIDQRTAQVGIIFTEKAAV